MSPTYIYRTWESRIVLLSGELFNGYQLVIPREARFINLSRGDRARIAEGRSNLDLPISFSKVSAQLPSNKAKSRPLTVTHSHVSSFLACFAANICVLTCLFIVCEEVTGPISDTNEGPSKDSNP